MKIIDLQPSALTPDRVPDYLTLLKNATATRAALAACAELRALFTTVSADALMRRAPEQPDGVVPWLTQLAADANAARGMLAAEDAEASSLLKADLSDRLRFDNAALTMIVAADDDIRASRAAAEAAGRGVDELRRDLQGVGLDAEEVDRIVAARAEGSGNQAAAREAALATIVAATARRDALQAFLNDPLRRVDALGPALADELAARARMPAERQAEAEQAARRGQAT